VLLISRQGKTRLAKWYSTFTQKVRFLSIVRLCEGILSLTSDKLQGKSKDTERSREYGDFSPTKALQLLGVEEL